MSLHAIHSEDLGQWYSMRIMGKYGPFQSTTCIGIAKSRVSESGQLGVFESPCTPSFCIGERVLASSFIPLKIGPKESLNMADAFKKEERLCARRGGEVPRFHIDWVQHT